ncbi:MAG: GGDEF domain-containing protein [Rhodoferax sp.]
MLNQPTLLLVQVVFTVLTTVLLIAAALSPDALREQRLWALGNVMTCLGFCIGSLEFLPVWIHGGLSYGLLGLGLGLVLKGLRLFCGQDLSNQWLFGIASGAFAFPVYFGVVHPDQMARLVVSGTYLGVLNLACAFTLYAGLRGHIRNTMWVAFSSFAVLGMALILRAVYLIVALAEARQHDVLETIMADSMVAGTLAQVSVAFGLILLVSHRYAEKLNQLTMLDGLTGTLNRLGLERMGQRVLLRARQNHRPVAVVMVDADHFKAINDAHGHPAGDQVLQHLARMLMAQVRPSDLVVRYGGEEFALILDGSSLETARQVADRIRAVVESTHVRVESMDIRYRVSAGVCCSDTHGYALPKLIAAADAALYQAKQEGRNRVCVN